MLKKYKHIIKEALETMILTAAIFLFLITFVIQGYRICGGCMEPNLNDGERLLANRFIYRVSKPRRGDVVVFQYPLDPQKTFIKRVIGLPGDTVEIREGKVFINGEELEESGYVVSVSDESFPLETIPDDNVFVLGDNRGSSNDSRYWGDLPLENIRAKAWLRYWPLSRMSVLE